MHGKCKHEMGVACCFNARLAQSVFCPGNVEERMQFCRRGLAERLFVSVECRCVDVVVAAHCST